MSLVLGATVEARVSPSADGTKGATLRLKERGGSAGIVVELLWGRSPAILVR